MYVDIVISNILNLNKHFLFFFLFIFLILFNAYGYTANTNIIFIQVLVPTIRQLIF